jgi:hypothetical protein
MCHMLLLLLLLLLLQSFGWYGMLSRDNLVISTRGIDLNLDQAVSSWGRSSAKSLLSNLTNMDGAIGRLHRVGNTCLVTGL